MVDEGKREVGSRDEGKHTGRNDRSSAGTQPRTVFGELKTLPRTSGIAIGPSFLSWQNSLDSLALFQQLSYTVMSVHSIIRRQSVVPGE